MATTDDKKFALNEIRRINNKLNRFQHKSLKLWEKNYKTVEPEQNKLRRRIKEYKSVKKKEKNNFTQINTDECFFYQDQLNTINHTNRIIKDFRSSQTEKNLDKNIPKTITDFTNQKREITMKSYLIKIIEKERNKITNKNLSMVKSIWDIENKLDEDLKQFQNFKEIEKIKQKETERVMSEHIKENKNYYEKKKELMQQNKILLDEIDRMVKIISNLKEYRGFVHNIFGKEADIKGNIVISKKSNYDLLQKNEKDIEKIAEQLM